MTRRDPRDGAGTEPESSVLVFWTFVFLFSCLVGVGLSILAHYV